MPVSEAGRRFFCGCFAGLLMPASLRRHSAQADSTQQASRPASQAGAGKFRKAGVSLGNQCETSNSEDKSSKLKKKGWLIV